MNNSKWGLRPHTSWLFQTPGTKMIDRTVPNPNRPRLSIGLTLEESIGCGHNRFIDLKISRFNIVRAALR